MALAEMWRGNIAFRAAEQLADLPSPNDDAVGLVRALLSYSELSTELAGVYQEGGYQPSKLNAIESKRDQAKAVAQQASERMATPSCALVVDLQQ